MSPLLDSARNNPVLIHELRSRMRGVRAYWLLAGYLLTVAVVLCFGALSANVNDLARLNPVGTTLFATLITTQAVLIALIAPALTCGGITLEREHQTYEMLSATRLKANDVALGKLTASIGFLGLCLLSSLPLAMMTTGFGGVSPSQALGCYAILGLEVVLFGAIGLFWSVIAKNTITATVLTYPCVLAASLLSLMCGATVFGGAEGETGPGMGFAVLGGLCPFTAGWTGFHGVPFFGSSIPFWLPGLILGPVMIVLLCALTVDKFPLFTAPPRSAVRASATFLMALLTLALCGGLLSSRETMNSPVLAIWACVLILLAIAVPLTCLPTVDRHSSRSVFFLAGFRSLGLSAAWTALLAFIVAASVEGMNRYGTERATDHHQLYLIPVLLITTSFLFMQWSFGLAVLRWSGHRLAAIVSGVVAGGLAAILPLMVYSMISNSWPSSWPILYLCPGSALNALATNSIPMDLMGNIPDAKHVHVWRLSHILFHQSWQTTTIEFYLACAVVCLLAACLARPNRRAKKTEAPSAY